jgi:hypothetical protein
MVSIDAEHQPQGYPVQRSAGALSAGSRSRGGHSLARDLLTVVVLSAAHVEKLLDPAACLPAIEKVYRDLSEDRAVNRPRTVGDWQSESANCLALVSGAATKRLVVTGLVTTEAFRSLASEKLRFVGASGPRAGQYGW